MELKFHIDIPEEINILNQAFIKHGKKLFLIGGCVRDAVLGIAPKDFDVVTAVLPEEVQKILDNSGIHNIPKGIQFGVISAIINDIEIEVATFRADNYENGDGRRPASVEFSDMQADANRRDAKMNCLYYDIEEGKIIDLVGGLEDIKHKRVTPVGNPFDRIKEDKLRSLRYLRFSHRFDSQLDEDTKTAIFFYKSLEGVSNERIRIEFLSGLKSAVHPEAFLNDYRDFELFTRMFENAEFYLNFIKDLRDPILVLANILSPNTTDVVSKTLTNFTASNTEKDNILFLLKLQAFLVGFDKETFVPGKDGKIFLSLIKSRDIQNSNLSDEQILEWSRIRGLNNELVNKFLVFKIKFSATNFPDIPPSAELGQAITKANAQEFIKSL